VATATGGAIIAVDSSTYAESITVDRPLWILGRCARTVSVEPAAGAGITVTARGVRIEGLAIRGAQIGLRVAAGAEVAAEGLLLEANRGLGIEVRGRLELDSSTARGTSAEAPFGAGQGILAAGGAQVDLQEVALVANQSAGMEAIGAGTRIAARGSWVAQTRIEPGSQRGGGVLASDQAELDLAGVAVVANTRVGLRIASGARVRADGLVVRDTASGAGVLVRDAAELDASNLLLDRNSEIGLAALDSGTATITDGAIQRTTLPLLANAAFAVAADLGAARLERTALVENESRAAYTTGGRLTLIDCAISATEGDLAPGVGVVGGGRAEIRGTLIEDSGAAGVILGSGGGQATIEASIIADTRPFPGAQVGAGMVVNSGTIAVERSLVRDNFSMGIIFGNVRGDTARGTIRDSKIEGSSGRPDLPTEQQEGFGVWVSSGSTLTIDGSDLDQNQNAALGVHFGAQAEVSGAVFRRTRADPLGNYGNGVYSEGTLTLRDSALLDNTTIGLQAHGPLARVEVERCAIRGTRPKSDGVFGHGVAASFESTLIIRGSEIRGSAGAGLIVQDGAAILAGSLIAGNTVGIHVQQGTALEQVAVVPEEPAPKTVHVSDDTRFIDNQTRTGVGLIAVPDPLTGPGG
jgi:nitrous oxidase accessory protein NosD